MHQPTIWTYLFRTPHTLAWTTVEGVKTRYLEAGQADAPTVIFLHGTAGSLENFAANYGAYAHQFHVYGIDLLGCGFTDKPEHDYRIDDYARHVLAFMDAHGIPSASLVGVSLGSWVAARIAADHPDRVEALVMVAPAGFVADVDEERRVAERVRRIRQAAADDPTWESVRSAMVRLVADPADMIDDLIAVRLAIYQQPEMKAAMPRLLAFSLGGQDLPAETWQALRTPLLLVAAVDADNMFRTNAYAIADLVPNASLLELHGCDHWAQFERHDAFNEASLAFLTSHTSSRH